MAGREDFESMDLLPNRLAVAEFSPVEVESILGQKRSEVEFNMDNFNWVAAYLCEEVGIYEDEVVEWFRSSAAGLGNQTPMSVWSGEDGFWKVFEYAQAYKHQVDEDLAGEPASDNDWIVRSHQLGNYALGVIAESFKVAGVRVDPPGPEHSGVNVSVIHNPDSKNYLAVRRKVGLDVEGYSIIRPSADGSTRSSYQVIRVYPDGGEEPFIFQTGIARDSEFDSDIDGRPPSAGEVARFVVPLANEVKNRSLVPM